MKLLNFLLKGLVYMTVLSVFASCEELGLGNTNKEDEDAQPTKELQPDEQKAKLESVAVQMLEATPAEDVEEFVKLADSFVTDYLDNEDYDMEELFSFFEDQEEDTYTYEERNYFNAAKNQYISEYSSNFMISLSNQKGEFTFGRRSVKKENSNYDGLKLNIPMNGKNYTAEIKVSGKMTNATYNYYYYSSNREDGYWDEMRDEWVWKEITRIYEDNSQYTIEVPEKIEAGLYEEGNPVATITMDIERNLTEKELNPAVDNFNVKTTVVLNNGYQFVFEEVKYDGAKSHSSTSMMMKVDDLTLVSAKATCELQLEKKEDVYEPNDGYYRTLTLVGVKKSKNLDVAIDLLGQVQFKGKCTDVKAISDEIDAYYDALRTYDYETGNYKSPDEATALRHLNNINAKLDLGVYYDGGSNRQAKVEFEMEKESGWDMNGDGKVDNMHDVSYDMIPVIVFNDGSRYTVEDYFTEEAFENLLDSAENYGEEYDDLLGTYTDSWFEKTESDVMHPDYSYDYM